LYYCIDVAIFLFTTAVFISSSKWFICSWGIKPFLYKKKKSMPYHNSFRIIEPKQSSSPHDISCFDIGALMLSTEWQKALHKWKISFWRSEMGLNHRDSYWGPRYCS
jgi:hypothetical protein